MKNVFYSDITDRKKKLYTVDAPGVHVFYFDNKSGELTFTIKNPKAKLYVFGSYYGSGDKTHTLKICQKHLVPHAQSHVLIKGIFDASSRFEFRGTIHLTKNAHGAVATLENRNLLLSDTARVITRPILEIIPHDVTCTHAATVAPLNPEHIHTLTTRGITQAEAIAILTDGFLQEIKQKINTYSTNTSNNR